METSLTYLLIAGLAFWLGMKVATAWNQLAFKKILEELGIKDSDLRALALKNGLAVEADTAEDQPQLTPVEIRIEQHQGCLYAYRLDNDQFLGQGVDREQLIESLKNNLTNVKVIVDQANGADLIKP